jgi:hypothetical protein
MKLINQGRPSLPIENYSIAMRKAIAGLDARYMPAVPVKLRMTDHIFFCETHPWNRRRRTGTKPSAATRERELP